MLNGVSKQLPIEIVGEYYVHLMTSKDRDALFQIYKNPHIAKYVAKKTHQTSEDTEEFLKEIAHRMESGNNLYLGIYENKTQGLIGMLRFLEKEEPEILTIGYALNQQYWGKGIIAAVLSALIPLIREEGKYHKLRATVRLENTKSQRVLEKLGFKLKGSFNKGSDKVEEPQHSESAQQELERLLYYYNL